MATDFPDEATPEPVVLRPGMSSAEADLELANNEIRRLRLELAAARAKCEALDVDNQAMRMTLQRLRRR